MGRVFPFQSTAKMADLVDFKDLTSDMSFKVGIPGVVEINKTTATHDVLKDAYRGCKNCGKHINYHKNGVCP